MKNDVCSLRANKKDFYKISTFLSKKGRKWEELIKELSEVVNALGKLSEENRFTSAGLSINGQGDIISLLPTDNKRIEKITIDLMEKNVYKTYIEAFKECKVKHELWHIKDLVAKDSRLSGHSKNELEEVFDKLMIGTPNG